MPHHRARHTPLGRCKARATPPYAARHHRRREGGRRTGPRGATEGIRPTCRSSSGPRFNQGRPAFLEASDTPIIIAYSPSSHAPTTLFVPLVSRTAVIEHVV